MIQNVVVLGAGSAGLIGALTLKTKLPELRVRVVRSPEIGVIGVGEGTTAAFPRHFFEYLKLPPSEFYARTEPTWKLGLKFLWGPRREFYYTFMREYAARQPGLARNNGFYVDDQTRWVGPVSAFMAHDKAFPRKADGAPLIHNNHAFHLENKKLVAALDHWCVQCGVEIADGKMTHAEVGEDGSGRRIEALQLESGETITADLFVDASGFRSELLGGALGEPFLPYSGSLLCDRAVIGGWPRTGEPIRPYTVAETYEAGWCWQIEHEHWINRGYVFSSRFITDDAAAAELLAKNRLIRETPRVVKFRTGRRARTWVGNVVGMGNAVGFVEPLEATALQVICVEARSLADTLLDTLKEPGPAVIGLFNYYNSSQWDEIRDFLAVHYAFNTRIGSPFWHACAAETDLAGAAPVVEFFRENGPSGLVNDILLKPTNSFGLDGYQAMLVGQSVAHAKPYTPPPADLARWRAYQRSLGEHASHGLSVAECLALIRDNPAA